MSFFIAFQHIVPQHLLSRGVGYLAASQNTFIKNTFIKQFTAQYDINMSEALEENPLAYASFNDFFTRALKANARPIAAADNAIISPADGAISQIGEISEDKIFQAKGHDYRVSTLLGGDEALAKPFIGGQFATVYLSPRDYHRVHMPFTGQLKKMIYIPGDLFSVNTQTAENVPNLFARNERLVCLFDTALGPMAVVLVGAMIVAGIATAWAGNIQAQGKQIISTDYSQQPIHLNKGDELGRFYLGSTAIVLFGADVMAWDKRLVATSPVRMGEAMGVTL
ncbi:archaetidylserine decarboxylase [Agitococcus lubricus]|uniref:Phosphatidylserine decarboxylase proenzyme n=1 Tax=Agitococcus lubricus TaxID=1077255 RepID=A0A2T5IV02_9GAMM|nr:archaetidylserine decarboxylase [Agitococcus lubricus]PTQ87698.1 phosphatidylserine decarboxylase [Agitococcus lubricus]